MGPDLVILPSPAAVCRAVLVSRPCLILSHLEAAMDASGIETHVATFGQLITDPVSFDVCVVFQSKCDPAALALVGQQFCGVPTVVLIENPDVENISFAGFAIVVLGLPSIRFAVEAIRHAVLRQNVNVPSDPRFTPRENDLLVLLRRGLPNKLIAHQLGMSHSTVKAHMHNIMTKLNARSRTEVLSKLSDHHHHRRRHEKT